MISIPVVNLEGQQVSTVEVDPADFGGEVNKQLLHDVVVMYQANLRVGTHSAKTRGEVIGSGKKLFRQKGTGNARVGPKRTGKRRGGGKAHGPKPRDYSYTVPKKARRLATRMALLSKFKDQEAVVVQGLTLPEPKTKRMAGVLKALGVGDQSCLISTHTADKNLYLSARNIHGVEVSPVSELNAYSLLRRKRLVMSSDAFEAIKASAKAALSESATADGSE